MEIERIKTMETELQKKIDDIIAMTEKLPNVCRVEYDGQEVREENNYSIFKVYLGDEFGMVSFGLISDELSDFLEEQDAMLSIIISQTLKLFHQELEILDKDAERLLEMPELVKSLSFFKSEFDKFSKTHKDVITTRLFFSILNDIGKKTEGEDDGNNK